MQDVRRRHSDRYKHRQARIRSGSREIPYKMRYNRGTREDDLNSNYNP